MDEIQVRNYEDSSKKNFEDKISFRGKECDSPASPNKPKKKNDEDSCRESSSPDRLLIGVGNLIGEESNSSPLVLFKGETLLPSSYQRIPGQNGGNRRKNPAEDRPCAVQFLAGKASPAMEVSLLPFLSPSPSFLCRCARSPATGVAGFCCGRTFLFAIFPSPEVTADHRFWPPLAAGSPLLLPTAITRLLHRRSEHHRGDLSVPCFGPKETHGKEEKKKKEIHYTCRYLDMI